jgi:hypothetical protein
MIYRGDVMVKKDIHMYSTQNIYQNLILGVRKEGKGGHRKLSVV